MMKRTIFPLLILAVMITTANGQQTVKTTPDGIGYLQYLPKGYNSNSKKYPVVISLHGIKEKGNTASNVMKVANVGLPKYIKLGQEYSFIVISPQLKTNMGRWTGDYVMKVIKHVKKQLRIDDSRIYLTGLSLGGGGVWSVATAYPNVFAAIVPICSGYNVSKEASKLAKEDVPTWGFHGDADRVVGEGTTIKMINAINQHKPSPLAKLTIFPGMGHVIWDKVYKQTNALDWMLSCRKGKSPSFPDDDDEDEDKEDDDKEKGEAPVAKAGGDKTITLPANSVTLNGSGSDDGSIKSYFWKKKSGGTANLSGTNSKTLKVTNLRQGKYVFQLTVKDNNGNTDSDDVTVTVKPKPASSETNARPVAIAGNDRYILLPNSSTSIRGSARDDGKIVSYRWSKASGGSCSMSKTNTPTLKVSSLRSGVYVFRLTVKDDKGNTDSDEIKVTVNAPPVAKAGGDKNITLPASSVRLQATASDADGTIRSYLWSKASGPNLRLKNNTSKVATMTNLHPGTYVMKLAVKDDLGAVAYDYVKIVVKRGSVSMHSIDESEAGMLANEFRLAKIESSHQITGNAFDI